MSSHGLKYSILKQEMAARGTTGRESYRTNLKGLEKQLMLPPPPPSGGWRFSLWRRQGCQDGNRHNNKPESEKHGNHGSTNKSLFFQLADQQVFVCSAGCWKLLKWPKKRDLKVLMSSSPTYDPARSPSQEARLMATMAQKSSSLPNSVLRFTRGS